MMHRCGFVLCFDALSRDVISMFSCSILYVCFVLLFFQFFLLVFSLLLLLPYKTFCSFVDVFFLLLNVCFYSAWPVGKFELCLLVSIFFLTSNTQ